MRAKLFHNSAYILCFIFLALSKNMGWAQPLGLLIPFYIYPASSSNPFVPSPPLQQVLDQKANFPNVPMRVILNPNSGVGESFDQNYADATTMLQQAGIEVLGYVFTSYGKRSITTVENQITKWNTWYQPNGIFLDEMGDNPDIYLNTDGTFNSSNYYSELTTFAHNLNFFTMGNPGYPLSTLQAGQTVDFILICENPGFPELETSENDPLFEWLLVSSEGKLSFVNLDIPFTQPSPIAPTFFPLQAILFLNLLNQIDNIEHRRSTGTVYITNEAGDNPYNALPVYFNELVQTLNAL